MADLVALHGIAEAAETGLEPADADGLRWPARFRPLVGGFDRLIADITGPDGLVRAAADGLPEGPARAEAVAVRLRRRGVELEWREPRRVEDVRALLRTVREHGASTVTMARADPSLVPELLLGRWFDAGWRQRLVRRTLLALPARAGAAADAAFWRGVRSEASDTEWRRLTRSSYAALVYHRFAGELKPGQEKVDLAPSVFDRQLRLLRRLGFRDLSIKELLEFHDQPDVVLPRRAFVVTVDDGIRDCVDPLRRHADLRPQLFVPSAELGGRAHWLDGEPVLTWEDVHELAAAGVSIGAHARHHRRLTGASDAELADELAGSREELRVRLGRPVDIVAYPNGDHDLRVRRVARDAGYRAAFTTEKGRNAAGTDLYCLRRISVHGADGPLAVLWKAATGEELPSLWRKLRALRRRAHRV